MTFKVGDWVRIGAVYDSESKTYSLDEYSGLIMWVISVYVGGRYGVPSCGLGHAYDVGEVVVLEQSRLRKVG